MAAIDADRSEWVRRDERARGAKLALSSHVHHKLGELRCILAEHAVKRAYLFGSLVSGQARAASDVDLAVVGCPPAQLYRLASKLERALGLPLDLIDLDRAPADFADEVCRTGQRIFEREDAERT